MFFLLFFDKHNIYIFQAYLRLFYLFFNFSYTFLRHKDNACFINHQKTPSKKKKTFQKDNSSLLKYFCLKFGYLTPLKKGD